MTGVVAFIASRAWAQHGAVARWQLLNAGVDPSHVCRLIRNGYLHPVHRGVYAVGHRKLSRRGWMMAGVLAGGESALLGYLCAAQLWGLVPDRGGRIEVISPRSNPRRAKGLIIRRSRVLDAPDYARVDGIPVTSVERTLIDIAGGIGWKRLSRAFEAASRLEEFDASALGRRLAGSTRRGARELRSFCRSDSGQSPILRSNIERRLRAFIGRSAEIRSTYSKPQFNAWVAGHECDVVFFAERLVIEVDCFYTHGGEFSFERDRRMDADLQAAGFRVLRITELRLDDPASVLDDVIRLLALA